MEEITPSSGHQNCKNCAHPILGGDKYCSSCGQKNTDGRISIVSFFSVFFSTVFNLESKFFQTMGHIFIPGKLTVEFFKGRHKRYFHPLRFFTVSALICIASLSYQLNEDMNIVDIHDRIEKQVRTEKFLAEVDTIAQQTLEKFPENSAVEPAYDSLTIHLKEKLFDSRDSIHMNNYVLTGGFEKLKFKISNEDYLNLDAEELVDKYKVEGYLNRFVFKQKIKIFKDGDNFVPFVLGNSLWIILLMMPFLALILKTLYIRHDIYYVEHLVFSFHVHSFAFLLLALIGFILLLDIPVWLFGITVPLLFLYLYKALRKVYVQGRFKTFIKLMLVSGVYIFLGFFFFIFGIMASMAIF